MIFGRKLLTAAVLCAGLFSIEAAASSLELKTTFGYDFISQEYFLDSVTTDTSLSIWSLKTDYLDDLKARISLNYIPYDDRRLELQSSYEQSSELFRIRLLSDWRPRLGSSRLALNSELEWRDRYRGSTEFGDSYLYGYSKAALTVPLSEKLNSRIQLMGEFVTFDSTSEFNYDYYRVGPKIGLARVFESFSFLDANIFLIARSVPDSTELNYLDIGVDGSFFAMMEGGDVDLYIRFESKDYNRTDKQDDHYRFDFDARGNIRLGDEYFTRLELRTEIVLYDSEDPINFDYGRTGWAVLTGYETGGLSVAAGPAFELMMEQEGNLLAAEDYFEIGGRIDVQFLKAGRFFGSIESTLGYRNLSVEEQLQTDFMFERINSIGNFQFLEGLSINWLISTEWEWHGIREENSQIFLLSTNLSYSF